MSDIFGALTLDDTERVRIGTLGQEVVFEAIQEIMADWNADVQAALSVFVEKETDSYTERYLLPGSGKFQELGRKAPSAAVKRSGEWDVAYPLRGYGAALAGSRVDMAYMTVQELDAHLDTIFAQDLNTLRWRILTALFEDDNLTWTDPIHGSLTIRRLANADGATYPPIVGSEDDLTGENHYSVTGYAEGSISDSNQPVITIRDDLVEHFGGRGTFGDNIVVFHNSSATDDLDDLTGYTEVAEQYIQYGNDSDLAVNIPNVPGRIHARLTGAWLSEWDWIPTGFMLGIHLEAPRPLVMRVDPADTGLSRGLSLVARDNDYPLQSAYYERRFGFGVGNRLNGYALEVSTDGSYAPPSDYAE
jgi:hypothetical protein